MVFKCHACGRVFEKGATIVDGIVLCPSCAKKLDDIIDSCIYEQTIRLINGEKIDIDSCIKKYEDDIKKLNMRPAKIRLLVLVQLIHHVPLLRGIRNATS